MPDDPTSRATDPHGRDLDPGLRRRFEQLERVLGGLEPPEDGTGGAAPTPGGNHATPAALSVVAFPLYGAPGEGFISYRAAEQFTAASTIKVYVLQALMERVAAGDADLDDELPVTAQDQVSGSGVLKALTPGRRYTLRDLATLMIVVSDNTATNVLIEYVGVEALNASIQAHGWVGTRSAGKLQLAPVDGGPRRSPSVTTAADLADYFRGLWLGELLPAPLTEEAKAIYRKQQYCEMGRSIDYDSYDASIGEAPWLIASKSGSVRGVRNDAGVFEPLTAAASGAKPFVVAIMTKGCVDERFHSDNLGARVVGWAAAEVVKRLA